MIGTAAILAGGASRRFGAPKALHSINGRPMISNVGDRLQKIFKHVIIAGWPSELAPPEGLPHFLDAYPGRGALGGIHTALTNSLSEWTFCCACDMPFIQDEVIRRTLSFVGLADIIIPEVGGVRQPLHAVYARRLLPGVERLCLSSDTFLPDLLKQVTVRYLDESSFADISDYALPFVSLDDRLQLDRYAGHLANL